MKKTITTLCLIGSLLIILAQFNVFESLIIFLIAGVIPGTNYVVPYQAMLFLLVSLISLVIFRIVISDRSIKAMKRHAKSHARSKKNMPKRRYSQI